MLILILVIKIDKTDKLVSYRYASATPTAKVVSYLGITHDKLKNACELTRVFAYAKLE